ncbi:hypothetical protein AB1Y20_008940 [Prymnesium parvum]|uniref:AAA+ ATPase domain-containing protein n=1 Tax=Prymnesium parvum TaxID=97485 RepID=A0AB34K332_PRYPA
MKGEEALAALVELSALSIAAFFTFRWISRMADTREAERASAQAKGRAALAARLRGSRELSSLPLQEHELEVAVDVVAAEEIRISFADVGGLDTIARQLQQAILLPLKRPDLFARTKLLRPPKGILLHGPPGTGKTMLARAIAKEAHFTFINLNPARLLSKWYGESNKYAEAYFSLAHKLAPSILFIDEIDCLFSSGHTNEHEATATLRAQFLQLWDGLLSANDEVASVVVLAATNRPSSVDPAVLRRLPLSFKVDLPTLPAREAVLKLFLQHEPLAAAIDLRALAAATDGYSGSDLEQLCKTAMMRPLEEFLEVEQQQQRAREQKQGEGDVEVAERVGEGGGLRCLTMQDFLEARTIVPPSRARFGGGPHGLGQFNLPPAPDQDVDLYD